jgi:hypothetical protein
VCGPSSAIGLDDSERLYWPQLRERLREPGRLMGLMRGLLAEDAEVAVVVATTPQGQTEPLAVLVTPMIEAELDVPPGEGEVRPAKVGDYDVEVVMAEVDGRERPIALLMSPWIRSHLLLYARKLWRPRRR